MDILQVTPQPAPFINRQNADGGSGFVETVAVGAGPVSSTTDTATTGTQARHAPTSNQVAQAIKQANDAFTQKGLNLFASFEKDKISGVDIVKIVEKKTNEVIRQLPPPEMVRFAQSLALPSGWRGQWIRNMS